MKRRIIFQRLICSNAAKSSPDLLMMHDIGKYIHISVISLDVGMSSISLYTIDNRNICGENVTWRRPCENQ